MKPTDIVHICSNVNLTIDCFPLPSAGKVKAKLRRGKHPLCGSVSAGSGSVICLQLLVALHAPVRENKTVPGGVVE